jgi:hypothetical protein
MPLEPELLGYQNTQLLIIGEGFGEFRRAVEEQKKDAKDNGKEKPEEELEQLEEEVSSGLSSNLKSSADQSRTMTASSISRRMILCSQTWVSVLRSIPRCRRLGKWERME